MWFWCGLDENCLSGGIRLDCRQREGESGTVQGDFVIGFQIQLIGYDWSDPENTLAHNLGSGTGDASLPAIKQNCIYLGILGSKFNLIRVNLCTSVTPRCFQKQQIHLDRNASQAAGVIKADRSLSEHMVKPQDLLAVVNALTQGCMLTYNDGSEISL